VDAGALTSVVAHGDVPLQVATRRPTLTHRRTSKAGDDVTMVDPHAPSTTQTLLGGKYLLGPVLGSGGVGTVYRATHVWTERQVAIKVLDPSLPHFDHLREGFVREARAAVALDHPHVVDVLDMGEVQDGAAYLVMEYLEGPTLREALHAGGALSAEETMAILWPLIDALEKAHELGIVHRDFKPENILLCEDSSGSVNPKLLDFGVAEEVRGAGPTSASDTVMSGTPQYISPEQALDRTAPAGPHTDVWGVGVVWYECLVGRPLFDGTSAVEILERVCRQPVDFEGLPAAHAKVLREVLVRSPEERIATFTDLKQRIVDAGIEVDRSSHRPGSQSSALVLASESEPAEVRRTLRGLAPVSLRLAEVAITPAKPSEQQEEEEEEEEPFILQPRQPRRLQLVLVALGGLSLLGLWLLTRSPELPSPPAAREQSRVLEPDAVPDAVEAVEQTAQPNPRKAEPEPLPTAEAAAMNVESALEEAQDQPPDDASAPEALGSGEGAEAELTAMTDGESPTDEAAIDKESRTSQARRRSTASEDASAARSSRRGRSQARPAAREPRPRNGAPELVTQW